MVRLDANRGDGVDGDAAVQRERGLDRGVRMPARWPRLDRREPELPRRLGCGEHALGLRVGASGDEEALRAFENLRGTREAARRELGGQQAGLGSAPGMQMLAHRVFFEELPQARGLRAGIA